MSFWKQGFWKTGFWKFGFWQEGEGASSTPDVVGDHQISAVEYLESLGFVVVEVFAYSPVVVRGVVASQSPAAGAPILDGGTVTLTISLGTAPETLPRSRRVVVEPSPRLVVVPSRGVIR